MKDKFLYLYSEYKFILRKYSEKYIFFNATVLKCSSVVGQGKKFVNPLVTKKVSQKKGSVENTTWRYAVKRTKIIGEIG